VEPLDLVHQFLGSSRGGKRLEVADRPVHAVAALEDDLPDRAVGPTPTLRFFFVAASPSVNIRLDVGPSTVTGFSMKTFRPFSIA
jgi:hypothetical protein